MPLDVEQEVDVLEDTELEHGDVAVLGICSSFWDCEEGLYCIAASTHNVERCHVPCLQPEDCPDGWKCVFAPFGPSEDPVCVPEVPIKCRPCATDAECVVPSARCVGGDSGGSAGGRCALDCLEGAACEQGSFCTDIDDGFACVPDAAACTVTESTSD